MLRFILKRKFSDRHSGCEGEDLMTMDLQINALEIVLRSGGFGMDEYERTELVGVEIIGDKPE